MTKLLNRIDGVVIGVFLGFDGERPLVVFPGNPRDVALPARSLAGLAPEMIGAEVALLFEGGDPECPLIVGRVVGREPPDRQPEVRRDGETLKIMAKQRIELRCGKATIIMEKDGRITIRGSYLTSHASATNRIRGGSVNLN
ncbi:hypothetical protein SAMN04488498_12442 [Mesorhizobium albiziae]|uniref:DUF6484 domain-containing protein n=1 Tax=Neomesorhizobium albiziae TaxID=335020 RepID=A0A1I4EEM1_9HYPH|nr:DUF6484 domain-containing protein [Mesorhizobium albiziae]GLS31135.1 hypothetical protein GCM10007937_28440 [Mesorhizobium albiziae]SFL02621.1 hypothetical protein SAMN04488498_12442 [Mesorhizobium albiziae]